MSSITCALVATPTSEPESELVAEMVDGVDAAVDAIAVADWSRLERRELATHVVTLQRALDRLTLVHARAVAEADRAVVWQGSGARNMADWLTATTATSYGDAVRRIRLADTLTLCPAIDEAVACGAMSVATADVLAPVIAAPPAGADTAALVELVGAAGPRDARRTIDEWIRQHDTTDPDALTARRHDRRAVRFGHPVDGLVTTTVVMPVLATAQVRQAISAAAGRPAPDDARTTEQRLADGLLAICGAFSRGELTGGRERPTLLVTIDADALAGVSDVPGVTAWGERVAANELRHLADSAIIQRVVRSGSVVLDLGTTSRLASDHQYRALVARDGGCRWPGCDIPAAWCEIDHLVPFSEGGPTDLANLVMWCSHHHHVKHRPGTTVHGDAHALRLVLADGTNVDCPVPGRDPP